MLSGGQKMMAVLLLACAVALGLASPAVLKLTIMTGFAALFLAVSLIRLASLSGPGHSVRNVRDEAKLSDEQLPVYTVLVPLFGEANVVLQIIGALKSLNYPAGKLDVKIIVEAHDDMTASLARQQAGSGGLRPHHRVARPAPDQTTRPQPGLDVCPRRAGDHLRCRGHSPANAAEARRPLLCHGGCRTLPACRPGCPTTTSTKTG
jgi:cellulose synthase/poly-beta-1,6-N-acetylglucosamine synthase-like glycosyltransferase